MNSRIKDYPLKTSEDKVIERITIKKLIADIGRTLNVERGIFFLIISLVTNPGKLVRQFLFEGRFKIFHPVRFLLITSAVSLFFFWLANGSEAMQEALVHAQGEDVSEDQKQFALRYQELFNSFFNDYFNALIWMFIPFVSLFSYLFFIKSRFNFAENLILNTYVTSIGNIINLIAYVFSFFINLQLCMTIATIGFFLYILYAYKSFFRFKTISTIFRGLAAIFLSYFIYMIILFVIVGVVIVFQYL